MCFPAVPRKSTMAHTASPETSDCTKQNQFRIAKLKHPTLAAGNCNTQVKLSHGDSWTFHFELRSEAVNAPPLLAAVFSNEIFRINGSSGAQRIIRLQKPGFIPENPLSMFTELFFEIKQELVVEASKFSVIQSEYLKECIKRSRSAGIHRYIKPPETANAASAVTQFTSNLSFLVRLFFEIMEAGPEAMKFKAACDMPWLPDIYSTQESRAACDALPAGTRMKQLTNATSSKNSLTSGFKSLFTIKRK